MNLRFLLLALVLILPGLPARAERAQNQNAGAPSANSVDNESDQAEVEALRKEYWRRGEQGQVKVVQNRLYTKEKKFELGVSGGPLFGDAFLQNYIYGPSLAFHLSEMFSVNAYAWWASSSASNALRFVQGPLGSQADTNAPKSFWGGELRANVIYGKFSLLGSVLVHFDTYLSAGGGTISTESGNDMALTAGLGEQLHLSRLFALNLGIQLLRYTETVIGKRPGNLGQDLGRNNNLSVGLTLGVSVFLDPFGAGDQG